MKLTNEKFLTVILFILFGFTSLFSQNDTSKIESFIKKTEISGQWFLANQYNITDNLDKFYLRRGYLTIRSELNPNISVRYTQDITLDREGSDAGNVEIRMKYLYMQVKPFDKGFMKNSYAEFGLVPRPWLEFEQRINVYRSQGRMYIEKSGIINSADFGIFCSGLIGKKLDNNITGKHNAGKYGSYSFGVFNGAGYHDNELNSNKTVEARISYRPLPDFMPGLQFTYGTSFGKANIDENPPDFSMHLFFVSSESKYLTLTGQYYIGNGDTYGIYYFNGNPNLNKGFSFFGEVFVPKTPFSFFGRYDDFTSEQSPIYSKSGYFTGVTYRFMKNKLFAYYGQDIIGGEKQDVVELVLEVVF
ncbi:MAG: hypothetical protein L3J35_08310 [Bacteroidales bacterium]|nr:hypothetical protein [Bacteroidales bacterium]